MMRLTNGPRWQTSGARADSNNFELVRGPRISQSRSYPSFGLSDGPLPANHSGSWCSHFLR
jgi:hypothetical protein